MRSPCVCLRRLLGAHALRHSFAARSDRRTGKTQALSQYLGHSSVAITMSIHVHESPDDGELFDPEDGNETEHTSAGGGAARDRFMVM